MDDREQRAELRRFLKDRRGRLEPIDVGISSNKRRRVRGLRREEVADLAGIGVSWYTALESGEATVSRTTVFAVADALRLSESERNYLLTLTGFTETPEVSDEPNALLMKTMDAISFPAYLITATWEVIACNAAFCRVWNVLPSELPFNAVERMYFQPKARGMHGAHFVANVTPIVAMVRSAFGRRPRVGQLQMLRDLILAESELRPLWDAYELSDPLLTNTGTIHSPIGTFHYTSMTLANPGETTGLVVHVPFDDVPGALTPHNR